MERAKMTVRFLLFILGFAYCACLRGQMPVNGDLLYGPEWIEEGADYYRIPIAEDGLFRLSNQQLRDAGIPVDDIPASEYKMFRLGREIPLYTSTDQVLESGDYIEFRGRKNRNGLDSFLFQFGSADQLNPHYNFFTDTAAYFLTWDKGEEGKRYETLNYGLLDGELPEMQWIDQIERKVLTEKYVKPYTKVSGINVFNSRFVEGEGYGSGFKANHEYSFELEGLDADVGPVHLRTKVLSSYGEHQLHIRMNDSLVYDSSMNSLEFRKISLDLPRELLSQETTIQMEGMTGNLDRYAIGFIEISYPRTLSSIDWSETMMLRPPGDSVLFRWEGLNDQESYFLYRPRSTQRIQLGRKDGIPSCPIGSTDRSESLELYAESDINIAPDPQFVNMKTYDEATDRNYIILTSRRFLNSEIQEYAEYRASEQGGSFRPVIIEVEDLYNTFAYGIRRHNIAVRNFMHYIENQWDEKPYVFIIGKGREHDDLRSPEQLQNAIDKGFYVPTFGSPGSDNLMLASNTTSSPIFPIGRLAVSESDQIKNYLNKVKVMESYVYDGSVKNSNWLREVIHLNGGTVDVDQIALHFDRMEDTLRSSIWNPNVSTIIRSSNEPVQTEDMEEIFKRINQGVNLVNYFGHSSATTLSIDINRPDAFQNYNHIPFLLTLGCNAGNLNIEGESLGETYVLYEGKGFIGSWASGHYGILQILGIISQRFYSNYAKELRGASIGRIIQKTLSENQALFPRHTAQMMLMGDPAYRIPMPDGTDLTVDPSSVEVSPGNIPTTRDSFSLRFDVSNLGLEIDQETQLQVIREYPDGSRDSLPIIPFQTPGQRTSFEFELPVGGLAASGINTIYIEVDPYDSIAETPVPTAEENNALRTADSSLGFDFLIEDKRIRPLLPYNFAIVPHDTVTLIATGTRHSAGEQSILIQMDTSEQFNSPALRTFERSIRGNTVRQSVEVRKDQVYYWRSSGDFSTLDTNWTPEIFSFIHLPGKRGWNQSHRGQFGQDSMSGLQLHPESGYFWLDTTTTSYNLKNQYYLNSEEWLYITHDYGHVRQNLFWLHDFSGAYVIVIDPITTLLGMKNPPHGAFGSHNPFGIELRSFAYYTDDSTSRRDLMNFIADTIPDSMFVIFTLNPYDLGDSFGIEQWQGDSLRYNGKNLFNFFEQYGAKDIRKLKDRGSVPYTFMFRKGDRAYAEGIAESQDETIVTEGLFRVLRDMGSARTPWIGPVTTADTLAWEVGGSHWNADQELSIKLYGSDQPEGTGTALYTLPLEAGDSTVSVSADNRSYYALELFAADPVDKKISPLHYWRMFHSSSLPELIFDPETHYQGPSDTVPQGYREEFQLAIRNVGQEMQDSFEAHYQVVDQNNDFITSGRLTMPPLSESEYSLMDFTIDPEGATGTFTIFIQLNPDEGVEERSYENNIFQEEFYIRPDRDRPELRVRFDGRRLYDYEPIRSDPVIQVRLTDHNPVALIDHPSAVEWTITQPDGSIYPLAPTDPEVDFSPAEIEGESAYWTVQTEFTQTGVYLFRVNGTDVAGNKADEMEYSIHFRIEDNQRISYLRTYPNPMSSYTRFRYKLEGGEAITDYRIEVFNSMGQRVRVLTEKELGVLYPGERYTEGYWRGTDQQDTPLDSGLYFYKLFPESHSPEHLPRSSDSYFENGWGRLTIIR